MHSLVSQDSLVEEAAQREADAKERFKNDQKERCDTHMHMHICKCILTLT